LKEAALTEGSSRLFRRGDDGFAVLAVSAIVAELLARLADLSPDKVRKIEVVLRRFMLRRLPSSPSLL
jgi:hypothetical protein